MSLCIMLHGQVFLMHHVFLMETKIAKLKGGTTPLLCLPDIFMTRKNHRGTRIIF